MINKTCLECDTEFSIEIKNGSGGTAALRKKYCSEKCKRQYKFKNGKNNFVVVVCEICEEEIKKFPSLVKDKNYCSRKCQNIALNGIQQISQKRCLICDKEFSFIFTTIVGQRRKFCSHECAYEAVKKKPKTGKILSCLNCTKQFYCKKYQLKIRKYCSNDCQYESQSKGIKKIPTNGRTGYRKDLPSDQYFKSVFEADYARYLIANSIPYEYEKHTFKTLINGKERFYTPDFYLPNDDKFIELKGSKTRTKYNENLNCVEYLKSQNKNIEVIYMNDFYKFLKQNGQYDTMFLEVKNYKKSIEIIKE
jgi:hypothetical protein